MNFSADRELNFQMTEMTEMTEVIKMTEMIKMIKMTKMVKFIKKSQKLISTKNNLLISRTAERHARGQKLHYEKLFSVLIKLNNIE